MAVIARAKYITDGSPKWNVTSDRDNIARFTTTAKDLIPLLRQLEAPLGSYKIKGIEVPQMALSAYITFNPRSLKKATEQLTLRLLEGCFKDLFTNPVELALTEIHKARARRLIIGFDFDGTRTSPEDLLKFINREALTIIRTRGGFHALVEVSKVDKEVYQGFWHPAIQDLPGCDQVGDFMTPIPGTFQGGVMARMDYTFLDNN